MIVRAPHPEERTKCASRRVGSCAPRSVWPPSSFETGAPRELRLVNRLRKRPPNTKLSPQALDTSACLRSQGLDINGIAKVLQAFD